MAKPEATFINSIHRYLKPVECIDVIGMGGTYTNGVPDVYYDGPKSDLWVEYKFIKKLPKRIDLMRLTTNPCLSALQDRFLERRHDNGHLAWVIIGCAKGGIILAQPETWQNVIETADYHLYSRHLFSRKELASVIIRTVMGKA